MAEIKKAAKPGVWTDEDLALVRQQEEARQTARAGEDAAKYVVPSGQGDSAAAWNSQTGIAGGDTLMGKNPGQVDTRLHDYSAVAKPGWVQPLDKAAVSATAPTLVDEASGSKIEDFKPVEYKVGDLQDQVARPDLGAVSRENADAENIAAADRAERQYLDYAQRNKPEMSSAKNSGNKNYDAVAGFLLDPTRAALASKYAAATGRIATGTSGQKTSAEYDKNVTDRAMAASQAQAVGVEAARQPRMTRAAETDAFANLKRAENESNDFGVKLRELKLSESGSTVAKPSVFDATSAAEEQVKKKRQLAY